MDRHLELAMFSIGVPEDDAVISRNTVEVASLPELALRLEE